MPDPWPKSSDDEGWRNRRVESRCNSMPNSSPISTAAQRDLTPLVLLVHRSRSDMSGIQDYLEREAFRVRRAMSGPGAVALAKRCHPDVVLLQADALDNGLQLLRQILTEVAVPIIIMAARDSAEPAEALDHGADDYVIEPAALPEIAARARAAVRRSKRLPCRVRRVGALELDRRAWHARAGNRRLPLTPSEYTILELLAQTPGQVVTRDDLIQAMGQCKANYAAALGQRIRRLQSKLSAAGVNEPFITTVRGVGYRLDT